MYILMKVLVFLLHRNVKMSSDDNDGLSSDVDPVATTSNQPEPSAIEEVTPTRLLK